MAEPLLVLFDDDDAHRWEPFALTRPAGELLFGALTLRARAERVFRIRCAGHVAAEHLAGFTEPGAPPVLAAHDLPGDGERIYLSSRALPAWSPDPPLPQLRDAAAGRPLVLTLDGEPCGWFAPAGVAGPPTGFFGDPAAWSAAAAAHPIAGTWLRRVWELISRNADQLEADIVALHPDAAPAPLPPGAHRLGDAPLVLGHGVELEPGVVLDLREGPIFLDENVRVQAFTRLAGPLYAGPGTTLLGGPLTAVSAGPMCKVHGEVETSVVLGYSNKAHDGFLGHAYLGQWVNLGALTTNSDLKNNYGPIRIETADGSVDTGLIKLGCLLGDHVKTAIGTLLTTGTLVGAGANLFGAGPVPRRVEPFTWGAGPDAGEYDVDRFLDTAAVVMSRRGVELGAAQRELLRGAWRIARGRS